MMSLFAPIKFRPHPPALLDRRNAKLRSTEPLLNESTSGPRDLLSVEPSSRTNDRFFLRRIEFSMIVYTKKKSS